jgi:subtilisin-like proprotein convertase family protein
MKYKYLPKGIAILLALFSVTISAQNAKLLWADYDASKASQIEQRFRKIELANEQFFQLNLEGLKNSLLNVGSRGEGANTIISFPNSEGELNRFEVYEASIMTPELQAQYPNMKTYKGQGIDNPSETIRFSITPKGFHAMFLGTAYGTQFIDPFSVEGNVYTVYSKKDLKARDFEFECAVIDDELYDRPLNNESTFARNADDGILRDYRIAIAATQEYTNYHGGTVAGAMAAMVVTMNRVNGIYERDLSITMTMVPNSNIIFTSEPDGFDNNNAGTLIGQSQSIINANIGAANYDIGHTFSTGGGGLAGLGVTCNNFQKASGITGSPNPEGDPYDIDFVAHELGHQFGAPHTFNGTVGSCSGGNRSSQNAYEPGSGSTIMAYAGICGSDNIQNNSDAYFHQNSLVRIWNHVSSTGVCPVNRSNTGNTEPTADAGNNHIIPRGTPYKLDASASSDPDGNASLTYTWEQYDLGPAGLPTETTASGPLVRSFEGTTNPVRYVPRLQDLINTGGSTTWEKLANVNRGITYRVTVRDNDASGGQTDYDSMTATVTTAAGPFTVTSQNTSGQSWDVGSTQTVTWNVAGTTGNGVNEANVNILLSTDGINYDTVLASNVPNDGSHDIVVPDVSSVSCRIMVEAANGIFFNINSDDISINAQIVCTEYSTGAISTAIPDGAGANQQGTAVFVPVTVADNAIINGNIKVNIDVTHSYIGDLVMQLQAPSGTFANIWARTCNSAQFGNIDVTLEDGQPAINCASPTTGTFAPANPLSVFDGEDINGTWNLVFVDFYNGDTGTVNSWSLELCTTTGLSVGETELDNLSIYPNPNNGTFNIGFNPKSGENINIEVYDIRGRAIFTNSYNSVSRFDEVISLDNAQSGVYLLNISDGSNKITKKIIVD